MTDSITTSLDPQDRNEFAVYLHSARIAHCQTQQTRSCLITLNGYMEES